MSTLADEPDHLSEALTLRGRLLLAAGRAEEALARAPAVRERDGDGIEWQALQLPVGALLVTGRADDARAVMEESGLDEDDLDDED
ncbi:hypothetical protein [Catenuloplanes indicus]|uniref:Tetratricopeptide repeat protein n=1 Tax=Catenuloplanes indicus TaxID=137267 RepID=A0AAE3W7R5_9ACTN|nr:hypothetical protein [Catenuloplanes indicus]MDQ0371094.1 hypothetical protein [Catenuloplanes indicus]